MLPRIPLRIVQLLSSGKGIVVHGLQAPLAYKYRELTVRSSASLTANGRRDVLAVRARGSKPVEVAIDDDVGGGIVEWRPERFALETVLQHERDARVNCRNLFEYAGHVCVDVVGAVCGESSRRSKACKVRVGCFVDWGKGEGVEVAGGLHESEDSVDCFE